MKNFYTILYLILVMAFPHVVAQSLQQTAKTAQGANDPAAHACLSRTAKWLSSMAAVDIRFNACAATAQTLQNPTGCQRGSMLVQGEQFRVVLGSQTYYCNGSDMWFYDAPNKEASVYTYDGASNFQLNPVAILKDYKKHYRAKYIRQETRAGQSADIIDLTPLEASEILKIRLYVNLSGHPLRMELYYGQDNIYVYDISSCKNADRVSVSDFTFKPENYPGITVNDMR